jgi:hypothetical protein
VRPLARRCRGDSGSAVVDFVLVGALLTLVFVGVVQLAVVLHVRNTLVDCASEGARFGALADRTPADGAARTRELIGLSLSPRYADDVTATTTSVDGVAVVQVRVRSPLPVIGLLGPSRGLDLTGHGVQEVAAP